MNFTSTSVTPTGGAPLAYDVTGDVFVTFAMIGFHRWPGAPQEVIYLRSRHRHVFEVRVDVSVDGQYDRNVEYHMLKRTLAEWYNEASPFEANEFGEAEFEDRSCESIALTILDYLRSAYPGRPRYRVEVSEDGENGSVVEARLET